MFIGIDLGTSSLKAIVLDRNHRVRATASVVLSVSQPQPLWREQDPEHWWTACQKALAAVLGTAAKEGIAAAQIEAIGLTGQMHGATLQDANDRLLRPAILWNDGRSSQQCIELEKKVPGSRAITGNIMMPGFTAPKLLWVAQHEPQVFDSLAKVLLPKDYLRLKLTGEYASDMSDAAGMLLLDMAKRDWSDELLQATDLHRHQLPKLYEDPQSTGILRSEVAQRLGLARIPVVAGASDNAAGALGMGITDVGQAMLSVGTSGVYFTASDGFRANPAQAVHSFCHALPNEWHLMSVMLSAASCLDHAAQLTGVPDVATLLNNAQVRGLSETTPLFLPYLNGERTPHNNANAKATYFGIDASTTSADIANATLEGVAHGLTEGIAAVEATGVGRAEEITLIGGGSRSAYWAQMLADTCNRRLVLREGGEVGPALGAARLARLGIDGGSVREACPFPNLTSEYNPSPASHRILEIRHQKFQDLYRKLYEG